MIKILEQERNVQARKALQMKKKLNPVVGSTDDDMKEIEKANQVRLRAISMIQALLNMWILPRRHILLFLLNAHDILVQPIGLLSAPFKTLGQAPDTLWSSR